MNSNVQVFERSWKLGMSAYVSYPDEEFEELSFDYASQRPLYVGLNSTVAAFNDRPHHPAFQFSPGGQVDITIDVQHADALDVSFAVVEYGPGGQEPHFYTGPRFTHRFGEDTESFVLAARIKGTGRIELGTVTVFRECRIDDVLSTAGVSGAELVRVGLLAVSPDEDVERAALAVFEFIDGAGDAVVPFADLAIHPKFGLYSYLEAGTPNAPRLTIVELNVPAGATQLRVTGVSWKKNKSVYLASEPTYELTGETDPGGVRNDESIESFVASIPLDEKLIVLYTTAPPLGHPTLLLRPNRMTKEFAKLGHWVVFFPFSRVPSGENTQGERVRQYSREELHRFLGAAGKRRGRNNVFICSSFPDVSALASIDQLKMSGWTSVYEVRDDMEEFNRVGYSKWFHPQLERSVTKRVDNVITVSPRLAMKMDILRGTPGFSHVIPNGATTELISSAASNRSLSSYMDRNNSRTVGYIGHLTPSWFDWPLIINAAEEVPSVTFEIIGHGKPESLELPENVHFLGPKTHDEFVELAKTWKAGLIPFKPSTLTFAVDPNKIYEYLAVGLRVVTAQMGSVKNCPSTYVYVSKEEFVDRIHAALDSDVTASEQELIEQYLGTCTWSARAQDLLVAIGTSE